MLPQIIASISSLTLISRVTGYLLFTINPTTNTPTITRSDHFLIFTTIAINTALTTLFWTVLVDYTQVDDIISRMSTPVLTCADHYVNVFAITWLFCKRHKIVEILKILSEIEAGFESIGVRVNHDKHRAKVNFYSSLVFLLFIGSSLFGLVINVLHGTVESFANFVFSVWCFALDLTFMYQYIMAAGAIGVRFEKLNINVDKLGTDGTVQHIHMLISRYIRGVNEIYGPPLVANFAAIFCWGCLSFFEIITYDKGVAGVGSLASYGINLAVTFVCFYFMFTSIERATRARKRAVEGMLEMMVQQPERKALCMEFMTQLLHVSVNFSCGLFDVNWQFLYHVSGWN
jgi:hypothetical protein